MKGRVLVIDDEAEIRRNLTFGLMQEDYVVTACPDGLSAIHELNSSKEQGIGYDFLVTDIFMPDIDGLKILKVIKSQFPELPVVVITGFGDDALRFTALSEHNTGYLDKPFEVPQLVEAMEALRSSASTLSPVIAEQEPAMKESYSAYLTIHISDSSRSMDVFSELSALEGVESCDAVRGDMDIIVLAHASSSDGIEQIFQRVKAVEGVEVASLSSIERPKLDRDIKDFVSVYERAVKRPALELAKKQPGATSYFIVEIDPDAIQQIFTTVFFIDDVIFCDVVEEGTKLVGMITGHGAVGRTPKIVEKISEIEGVLRAREAKIIKMID